MLSAYLVSLLIAASVVPNLSGLNAKDKGLVIALESERRNFDRFGDLTADEEFIIQNRYGEKVTRKARVSLLEVPGDGDRGLVVFDDPADIRGTATLVHTHKRVPDDMWMFFPSARRVRRISADNKGGTFMGTDFKNEDVAHLEPEKYTYKWIRDENCGGQRCFVIERYPIEPSSIYSKQVVWIDQAKFRSQKWAFYDKNGNYVKSLYFIGYREYLPDHWRMDELKMVNELTAGSTRVLFKNWKFKTGLKKSDFTINSLRIPR